MAKAYVFYNALAGDGNWKRRAEELREVVPEELIFCDLTKEETYESSLFRLAAKDTLILCGGDGTLNQFINITEGIQIPCEIFYYPTGNCNNFARDLGKKAGADPFNITAYLKELPAATIRSREYRFLNGICCGPLGAYFQETCRRQREQTERNSRCVRAMIRKLLFHSSPVSLQITVDGILHSYQSVWLAMTMNGRFYGGMMPTPMQERSNPGKLLSVMVLHNADRLKVWHIFTSLFAGGHIRDKNVIEILTGCDIRVEFDQMGTLGIDGNMIPDVDFYKASFRSMASV